MSAKPDIRLIAQAPKPEGYDALRAHVGWNKAGQVRANKALMQSLHCVSLYDGDALIGFGRIIGDGAMNYYIQDVIVTSPYRGKGLGEKIMQSLMAWLARNAAPDATIGLMSVAGVEPLYRRFGLLARPDGIFGAGMTRSVEPKGDSGK